jgi:hypothetical protein
VNSIAGWERSQIPFSSVNCTPRIARHCNIFSPTVIFIRNRLRVATSLDALLAQVRQLPIVAYLSYILPAGVLVVEEDVHKKQVSIESQYLVCAHYILSAQNYGNSEAYPDASLGYSSFLFRIQPLGRHSCGRSPRSSSISPNRWMTRLPRFLFI